MYNAHTIGNWPTEQASAAALDAALAAVSLWNIYPEVRGTMTQPRPGQIDKTVRIDRILIPRQELVDLGWTQGAIGIEIKRSNEKIGPAIAQAIDYSRSAWMLPYGGIKVHLDWVFIWPCERHSGTIASILVQNRIGVAYANEHTTLHLTSGGQNILKANRWGVTVGTVRNGTFPTAAQKVGSR